MENQLIKLIEKKITSNVCNSFQKQSLHSKRNENCLRFFNSCSVSLVTKQQEKGNQKKELGEAVPWVVVSILP